MGQGLPTMQTVLDQPIDDHLRARATDEENELALLAQFMRHESVASLANAIAQRLGESVRGGDLIVAAGLGPNRNGRSSAIPLNPDAGLRR
jgi:hypothetical protein